MAWDARRITRRFQIFFVVVSVVVTSHSVSLPSAFAATLWSDVDALHALLQDWNATPGLPQNWTWGSDPCRDQWIGVSCLQETVISLRLGSYGIRGTLSPSVGELKNLLYLNLPNNPGLTGEIPDEIGNLNRLFALDLSNCSFSGRIPLSLGELRNASYIYLERNQLFGQIPNTIGYLSKLFEISLGQNYLSGRIPVSSPTAFPVPVGLNNLTSLLTLNLEYNRLSGEVPSILGQLQRLTTLVLRGNNFSGCLACDVLNGTSTKYGLNNLTELILVDLSWNSFVGPPPQFFLRLPLVSDLNLSVNHFDGVLDGGVRTSGNVNVYLMKNNITSVTNFPSQFTTPTLGGNPVCTNQSFPYPDLCDYTGLLLGPTKWQQPESCSTQCNQSAMVHPVTCNCSNPYIFNMLFAWTATFGLEGARIGDLRRVLATALNVPTAENLWIENATYVENQLSAKVLCYPPSPTQLWLKSQLTTIETQLVNKTIKLGVYDPYAFVSSNLQTIQTTPLNEGSAAPIASPRSNHQSTPIIAGAIGGFVALVLLLGLLICIIKRRRTPVNLDNASEIFDLNLSELPNCLLSYDEIKSSTRSFHRGNKIGEGPFGPVYKGTMRDGSEVAVKELPSKIKTSNQHFLDEVETISVLQHKNLVKLRGCGIRHHSRLLVYEYVEKKCLAQSLFGQKAVLLGWPVRYNVALGMAKGLAYLHSRGPTSLAHGDLKASNILLDRNMEPKIADFGLARMCHNHERKVLMRIERKRGYVAPEYARYGQLTPTTDVFSFGIIALELVSGRKSMNDKLPAEEQYLLSWAWNLYEERRVLDLIDPRVRDGSNEAQALLLIHVALLCSQGDASSRPGMSRVVSLLSGDARVPAMPPRPAFLGLGMPLNPTYATYARTRTGPITW